jgi:hypothetical protein
MKKRYSYNPDLWPNNHRSGWGARKLTGENLRVVWAQFSTLSLAVLQNVYNPWPVQTRLSLDLKTVQVSSY